MLCTVDKKWKKISNSTSVYFWVVDFFFLLFFIFFYLWWILSYIEMKQPWVYMCSPSQSPLPPPSPPVFPVHQVRALVSCIQPGLVICFTLDNILCMFYFI